NLQREYGQEAQAAIIMPLLEGTDGVQKMSKSLGNYIGINEPPGEMFGKVMSISDELMWRYYELLTDLRPEDIMKLRLAVGVGALNPRAAKVDLAKMIITDFHSAEAAAAAEEEFDKVHKHRETPDVIALVPVAPQIWKLARLLVETKLASSMGEARRLIEGDGVRVAGERVSQANAEVELKLNQEIVIQVGKRRHVCVVGEIPDITDDLETI
ncbi:MAG TPA: tyrosine--tRNA ligase, partial [Pyrinomonadaceae bacterium]